MKNCRVFQVLVLARSLTLTVLTRAQVLVSRLRAFGP